MGCGEEVESVGCGKSDGRTRSRVCGLWEVESVGCGESTVPRASPSGVDDTRAHGCTSRTRQWAPLVRCAHPRCDRAGPPRTHAECAPASQAGASPEPGVRVPTWDAFYYRILKGRRGCVGGWSVNVVRPIFEPYETRLGTLRWELSSLCYLYTVSRRPARRGDDTVVATEHATELTHAAGDVETGAGRTQAVPKLRHPTGVGSVAARVEVAAEARAVAPAPPQVRSVAAAEL